MMSRIPLLAFVSIALTGLGLTAQQDPPAGGEPVPGSQPIPGSQPVPGSQPIPGSQPGDGSAEVQTVVAPPAPAHFETGQGNRWFEATRIDLGTFVQEEEAVGKFKFKNPGTDTHKFSNLIQSCTCNRTVVRVGDRVYELLNEPVANSLWRVTRADDGAEGRERVTFITVEPGESGEVEVHMAMSGQIGPKDAQIDLQIDDAQLPAVKLAWRATGATFFIVEPPEWNLGEMTWKDKKDFRFEITSPMQPDFNLLRHDSLVKTMQVEYQKEMRGDKAVWVVTGTYGPGVDERDGGGPITFHTDVKGRTVTARAVAMIKGPLEMNPGGFLSLGVIRAGKGGKAEVRIKPTDDFDLQVSKLESENLSVGDQVAFSSHKEGNEVVVEIAVAPDVEKGKIVRGVVRVHLNHPSAPLKEIQFNGFVR